MNPEFVKKHLNSVQKGVLRNAGHNFASAIIKLSHSNPDGILDALSGKYRDIYQHTAYSTGNNFYGLETCLKAYSGYKRPLKAAIEHGVYFGKYVNRYETSESDFSCVVTLGGRRKQHIQEVGNFPVLPIGPYIHYAPSLLNPDDREKAKKELGKTLLVFPYHSIETVNVSFDQDQLLSSVAQIEEMNNIDSTLFCLYFNDINNEHALAYKKANKRVVCAGHRSDPLFLSRLRSLIELSDISASNGIGTHIGYCEYLGSRHLLIDMPVTASSETDLKRTSLTDLDCSRGLEIAEVKTALKEEDSAKKNETLNAFWGFDSTRSQEYLLYAFTCFERAYRLMKRKHVCKNEALAEIDPSFYSELVRR